MRRLLPKNALTDRRAFLAMAAAAASPAAAQPASPAGRWRAMEIRGAPVVGPNPPFIEIGPESAAGSGGCNRIRGAARISGQRMRFGQMISTRMACAPAVMAQEQRFLAALAAVRVWRAEGDELLLSGRRGARLLRLRRE